MNSPLHPEPQDYVVIAIERAVLCPNDHVYDAERFGLCPACQSYDRLSLGSLLSPEVVGPRLQRLIERVVPGERYGQKQKIKLHFEPSKDEGSMKAKAGGASTSNTPPEQAGDLKLKGL